MRSTKGEALRFIVAGATNTLTTYVIYLIFLKVVEYQVAFTISFIIGIFIAFFMNSVFVFRAAFSWSKLFKYPLIYITQYLLGLALIAILVEHMGLSKQFAPLINIIFLVPITFCVNRLFLSEPSE